MYEVDVEIWPTSIVFPKGYTMALTIGGKDFERAGATGMMKGSGIFMHDSARIAPRRSSPERARCTPAARTGAICCCRGFRRCDALNVPQYLPLVGGGRRAKRVGKGTLQKLYS